MKINPLYVSGPLLFSSEQDEVDFHLPEMFG